MSMLDSNYSTMLVARQKTGDLEASDTLLRAHRERVYRFAYHLTRNHEDAEDITAEAFVRAHRALKSYQGKSSFSTWLCRIVVNCFLDSRKKAKNNMSVSFEDTFPNDGTERSDRLACGGSPHREAARGIALEKLSAAMTRLPEYQRTIIVLFHVEMRTYEEIGKILQLPLGTVKSRMNRARLTMRDMLAQEEDFFVGAD